MQRGRQLPDGIRLIHTAQRDINACGPAGSDRQIRHIGADSLGKPVLLLIGRIPGFLRCNRRELPQGREGNLAAAVFDAIAPHVVFPNALFLGVSFQRTDGGLPLGDAEIMLVHALPLRAVPAVVAGSAGRHQMHIRFAGAIVQHIENLAAHQGEPAAGDNRHRQTVGQRGQTIRDLRGNRFLRSGERTVKVEGNRFRFGRHCVEIKLLPCMDRCGVHCSSLPKCTLLS